MPALRVTSKTKYLNLAQQLRTQVLQGELSPGDKLPTFAELKAEFGLGQATLEKTYSLLEAERLIIRKPGKGTFVAEIQTAALHHAVALIGGTADQEMRQHHPFYDRLLLGIRRAAKNAGFKVMLLDWDIRVDRENVDGVLIMDEYTIHGQPLILGMARVSLLHEAENSPGILIDNYGGSRLATKHLLGLGHRRIAFLTQGRMKDNAAHQRLIAYTDTLRDVGIEPPSAWVRNLREPFEPQGSNREMGHRQMKRWLESDWDSLGCTAILAQNDEVAIGIIEALQERGINVPGQVSVVGFDGIDEISQYYRPRLTTLKVPLEEIGVAGMDLLLKQIHSAPSPATEKEAGSDELVVIPVSLETGESTAPPQQ